MWGLFFNLVSVALLRLVYKWQNVGIIIIHFGLLLFLISGFITHRFAQESFLTLPEGRASNVSTAYHDWEISVWKETPPKFPLQITREVMAVNTKNFKTGQVVDLNELGFQLTVKEYRRNCNAYVGGAERSKIINASGIHRLKLMPLEKEPQKNTPGGVFDIETAKGENYEILLFGGESKTTIVKIGGVEYNMMLRLARYPLPFTLKLVDFMMEKHPGTDTARSFKSLVAIETKNVWRDKLISMNNPLRYKDYTLYQSSYAIDNMGYEFSTLAVVANVGRILPYISTFVTFGGLVIHFILMAFTAKKDVEPIFVEND